MIVVLKLLACWIPLGVLTYVALTWHSRADAKAQAAILELLAGDEAWWYGLALVRASRGALKRGTVYVHLGRLEEAGLVLSCIEAEYPPPAVGIRRRLYRISLLGRQRLEGGT